jgi:hypothetical protein
LWNPEPVFNQETYLSTNLILKNKITEKILVKKLAKEKKNNKKNEDKNLTEKTQEGWNWILKKNNSKQNKLN